ncbi:aspartyl-tRNA(Asn)/glutamyl-tRNA(Gln) amidotransferase subunit A [Brevibacterium sanguinis]|uniref:Aspartyl-tRNA(Asn)/glutamyl-tRNA(Gln) amidotransferase subunit A n=2 Tax=Brevibacterium TaxID=1696 RepID=A0A366IHR1_9MICO|nr:MULTISPECIES: amidase [Brevibacterium]RBP62002.1 aspartyl-tRNA(Asn)/glutamyl-tRNA(Gln) amidotransferase subunit A [Brevibacterium sanguinis]RBP70576.1 aspartyl-tRNA(Asn)/glutamyl-tRNA(Gln) amidotransferase subunit A [Brevibacterium celere]
MTTDDHPSDAAAVTSFAGSGRASEAADVPSSAGSAPASAEPWTWTAAEALATFRTRQLSPVDYLDSLAARIAEQDPEINAVTEVVEEARSAAVAAERVYASSSEETLAEALAAQPLLGLPVLAKEKHALAGHTLSQGLVHLSDEVASEDATIISRIRAAGGFVHARVTSPEFSCATFTHSPMWGVTRNPWNLELSPGGSSGGSGAGLAAGYGPLATASDIAGSTRLPAAFTGTVGYKAPYGRIPGAAPLSLDWYRGDGPMARTVADTALLAQVMVGVAPGDHSSVPSPGFLAGFDALSGAVVDSLAGRRIALCVRLGDFPVAADIEANTRKVAAVLESTGAVVEEIELPWTVERIFETAFTHFGTILAPAMRALTRGHEDTLADYTLRFMDVAEAIAARRSFYDGLAMEAQIQAELATAMDGYDVLLAPTSAVAALEADGTYLDGISVGERTFEHYWQAHMTVPFNIANRVPIVNVPSGMADCGIPTGLQVIGHPYEDRSAFDVAAAIEQLLPWTGLAPR